MLIGIMSDAHDRIQGVKDALRIFSQKGVEMVLFAGDMIGSGNCYTFDGFSIPVKLVFGNNDGDRAGLEREFARVGGEYLGDFGEIEADGLKIAMLHGTEEALIRADKDGKTLLVNPGEIWRHFTGPPAWPYSTPPA